MKAIPLTFRPDMLKALRAGQKTETRRMVQASNSWVLPGTFEALDLETARSRATENSAVTEIRARCAMPAGVRVATVSPRLGLGDMIWTRKGRGARRADSRLTLVVTEVHARRVQDMDNSDALAEGVHVVEEFGANLKPRARFAMLWDAINGAGSWAENPWVWVYRFDVQHGNIDALVRGTILAKPRRQVKRFKAAQRVRQ